MTLPDYGAKNGTFASHSWLAGNTAVPFYYGFDEQLDKTIKFLRAGDYLNVDIFGIKKANEEQLIGAAWHRCLFASRPTMCSTHMS